MSAKKSVAVLIGGKVYNLSGYEEEEYMQKVAAYINGKIEEFSKLEGYRKQSAYMKATLLELNIADDYFKAKEQIEKYELDAQQKERDLYNLKHELITDQVKSEDNSSRIRELEKENAELRQIKAKLEASLEDALLGPLSGKPRNDLDT
jgi:cell division protein ZapA